MAGTVRKSTAKKSAKKTSRVTKKPPSAEATLTKIAGMSSTAVRKATGKTWPEWFAVLDRLGAATMSHTEIASALHEAHPKLGGWWSQMVTVGYERARGRRAIHEKSDGFSAGKSRVFPVPLARLWSTWNDAQARARWLEEDLVVRRATPRKSMRMTWTDGKSSVQVYFNAKGPSKSQVAIQHDKLSSAHDVKRKKAFWQAALDRLASELA